MNRSLDADHVRRTALAVAFVLLSTAAVELGAMGIWAWARSGFEWKVPLLLGGAATLLVVALVGLQRVLTGKRPSRLLALGGFVLGSVIAGVLLAGCSSGEREGSVEDLLLKRYGGDLACIEAVVAKADPSTFAGLREIADDGLDVDKWQEGPILDALAHVVAC